MAGNQPGSLPNLATGISLDQGLAFGSNSTQGQWTNDQANVTTGGRLVTSTPSQMAYSAQQQQLSAGGLMTSGSNQVIQTTTTTYGARMRYPFGYAVHPAFGNYSAAMNFNPTPYNQLPAQHLPPPQIERQTPMLQASQQPIPAPFEQSSQQSPQPTPQLPTPQPPPVAQGSLLTSTHDREMAARQTSINTMSGQERHAQELWAYQMIVKSGPCPAGFGWIRKEKGYRCSGGNHCITDILLQEGDGGFYLTQFEHAAFASTGDRWEGPYYKEMSNGRHPGSRMTMFGRVPNKRPNTGGDVVPGYEMRTPRNPGIHYGNNISGDAIGIGFLGFDEISPDALNARVSLVEGIQGNPGRHRRRR